MAGRVLRWAVVAMVAAHVGFSLAGSARAVRNRVLFARWWAIASPAQRAAHLYGRDGAELTAAARRLIRPDECAIVETDREPWLMSYYLYPVRLYQRTPSPEADRRYYRLSRRERELPPRLDRPCDWIIEDRLAGSERRQSIRRSAGRQP